MHKYCFYSLGPQKKPGSANFNIITWYLGQPSSWSKILSIQDTRSQTNWNYNVKKFTLSRHFSSSMGYTTFSHLAHFLFIFKMDIKPQKTINITWTTTIRVWVDNNYNCWRAESVFTAVTTTQYDLVLGVQQPLVRFVVKARQRAKRLKQRYTENWTLQNVYNNLTLR